MSDEDDEDEEDGDDAESSFNNSPLRGKTEKTKFHHPEPVIGLRDEDMTIDEVDADETMTLGSDGEQSEEDDDEDEQDASKNGKEGKAGSATPEKAPDAADLLAEEMDKLDVKK